MKILQKIIKNDAMKTDPPEIYNLNVVLITIASCSGALLYGMDMGAIGGLLSMSSFKSAYGFDKKSKQENADISSNIVSIIQAGAFLGSLVSAWLANRIGRRRCLILVSLIVFVGVAMQTAASGILAVLYVGRFIAGVAVGMASTVNPLYVSENAPRAIRGLLTGLYQFNIVTGLCLAFWVNYGSLLHQHGSAQYLIPLAMQALPGVILIVGMLLANESPRYLAQKDPSAALSTLAKLRHLPESHPYVVEEVANLIRQLQYEETLAESSSRWTLLKEVSKVRSNLRRTFISITLMMWSNFVGTNALNYYSPEIFSLLGITGSQSGLFATGIYGFVKMTACAVFLLFVSDSLGRRRSLIWTGIAQGITFFYIGFYLRFDPPVDGAPICAAGYISLVAVYLFAAIYQFGWGPVVWTYCSEIPSARLRPLTMGIATTMQWVFAFTVAKVTPLMIANLGDKGYGTFLVYGSCCFCAATFVFLCCPETKGLSLEFMDELFKRRSVRGKFEPQDPIIVDAPKADLIESMPTTELREYANKHQV